MGTTKGRTEIGAIIFTETRMQRMRERGINEGERERMTKNERSRIEIVSCTTIALSECSTVQSNPTTHITRSNIVSKGTLNLNHVTRSGH